MLACKWMRHGNSERRLYRGRSVLLKPAMHDTRAPFLDPCYRSRPVTGRNGQGFTTLPPSGPQEGCLGPTNSPTINKVINYSIREANFLLLTFTPMWSDQPRGRCEESLVDSYCLPSYEKQGSCFSSIQVVYRLTKFKDRGPTFIMPGTT